MYISLKYYTAVHNNYRDINDNDVVNICDVIREYKDNGVEEIL